MSEKLDAMFGADAADYIRQLQADNARLRALLKSASYHVECEGDASLLTDIRRALEERKE